MNITKDIKLYRKLILQKCPFEAPVMNLLLEKRTINV